MKIAVIGAGEIGRAITQYFLCENEITQITLMDADKRQLTTCANKLTRYSNTQKLTFGNVKNLEKILSAADLIFAAIPWSAHHSIFEIIAQKDKPMVTVSRPAYQEIDMLQKKLSPMKNPVVIGCGLEPGLTEILSLHCAKQFEILNELHIKCGGITKQSPNNILRYKALFGTQYLPIAMQNAYTIVDRKLIQVPRFSGVEQMHIPGIGELEAWHDGMVPWLYQYPEISSAHTVSQKTLRWPGFSQAVNTLNQLGLLSEKVIEINGHPISPKKFIERLYEPETKLQNEDNITLLHVSGHGLIDSREQNIELTLTAHAQADTGLNSLAAITGLTAVLIGSSILNGNVKNSGLTMPEHLIQGKQFNLLMRQLNNYAIELDIKNGGAPSYA